MPSIRLIASTADPQGSPSEGVGIECLFRPIAGLDTDIALARAVTVALNSDRRALDDDTLPTEQGDDRRGVWADTDAYEIWGGWPIGTRLWLMHRDKITEAGAAEGSTIEKARRYLAEALQPFVDAMICTSFTIALERRGLHKIGGTIKIYRGPKTAIALEFQDLWSVYAGGQATAPPVHSFGSSRAQTVLTDDYGVPLTDDALVPITSLN